MNNSMFFKAGRILACMGIMAFTLVMMIGCGDNPVDNGAAVVAATTATASSTSGTGTTLTPYIVGRIVTPSAGGLVGAEVTLMNDKGAVVARTTTLTNGDYTFSNVPLGVLVLTASASNYISSSGIVEVLVSGKNEASAIVMPPAVTFTALPTADITGRLIVNGDPLSVAVISVDSGQSTVSDALGYFTINTLASGTRVFGVKKPGIASFSFTVEIVGVASPSVGADGLALASKVNYNNQSFTLTANAAGIIRLANIGNVNAPYDLHESGALTGTVLTYQYVNGVITDTKVPVGGFQFELWVKDSDGKYGRYRTVVTAADGTWFVDNIPSESDNSFAWYAVSSGATLVLVPGTTTGEYTFSGTTTMYTAGYRVKPGKTTVMDFVK